ncbi:MAG: hypothetical protein ACYC36_06180 [Bellilinea sp.]
MGGWIGVDLDGTLAEYHGWKGDNGIGAPIPKMVERVKRWLSDGKDVRIMTARVSVAGGYSLESHRYADESWRDEQIKLIQDWCLEHVGKALPVTCTKDFSMIELWDDRCYRVRMNTGEIESGQE